MKLLPIIEHIKALADSLPRNHAKYLGVEGAREYRALAAVPGRLPRAYVIPIGRKTDNISATGVIAQVNTESFAVVTLIGETRVGEAASVDMLADIETALIDHMSGWRHPDGSTHVICTGGQDISVELGAYAWATTFVFKTSYRKAV